MLAAARRASHALLGACHSNGIHNYHLCLRLFESIVQPVALYAAEAWTPWIPVGKELYDNPLDQLQLDFVRALAHLRRHTLRPAILWEFGRHSLLRHALAAALRQHNRLLSTPGSPALHKTLFHAELREPFIHGAPRKNKKPPLAYGERRAILLALHTWCRRLNTKFGFNLPHLHHPITAPVPANYKDTIRDFDQHYQHNLLPTALADATRRHASTYSSWRLDFGFATAVDSLTGSPRTPSSRYSLHRFRLLNHPLPIEQLAWQLVPRDQRRCSHCPAALGDETHFLFDCPSIQHLRLDPLYTSLPFTSRSVALMSSANPPLFGSFLARAMTTYTRQPP